MINDEPEVPVTFYSKQKLAMLYNSDVKMETARRKLRGWIKRNKDLEEELSRIGYSDRSKIFTPPEVRIIFRYLGDP